MKKTKKMAVIIAMATIAGTSTESMSAAAKAAMQDMKEDMGAKNVYGLEYTYDPYDGFYA